LPREVALEALTIRPAEIAGAAEQLGSVEVGKIANLVVAEGEPLTDSTKVRAVFVDGIRYEVIPPAPPPRGNAGGGGPPAQMGGTWAVSTSTPQGQNTSTFTVTQDGASFTGTMATEMGTLQVTDGQIAGRTVTWSITFEMGGQSLTVTFRGEVEGNRIRGTAEMGAFGSFPFTAEKNP